MGGEKARTRAKVGGVEAATPTPDEESSPQSPSTVDAMGQDKRRSVIGHSYTASKARQLAYYGIFIAVVILLYIGGSIAVDQLDKAPKNNPDQAPWSKANSPQTPPQRFE